MMERALESLWDTISHNLPTKLVSILIAVVLWIVVLGSGTAEESKELALEIVTSSDMVVSNDIPERVTFRLSGPKAALRTAINRSYEPIRINLAGNKPGIVTHRFFADQIRLPIGVKVTSVTPNSVIIRTEAVTSKLVPLKLATRGVPPEGLLIKSSELIPETIKIVGPESRVQATSEVMTAPVDLTKITGSQEQDATLDLLGTGLKTEGAAPKVRFTVEGVGANFKIKNVVVRVLSSHRSKVEPRTVTAYVRAAPAELRKLDHSKITAEVRAEQLPKGTHRETVHILVPAHVTLVRVVPETINLTSY